MNPWSLLGGAIATFISMTRTSSPQFAAAEGAATQILVTMALSIFLNEGWLEDLMKFFRRKKRKK